MPEDKKQVMVSDYIGELRNGKYINADKLLSALEQESASPNSKLFAKVFPVPNFFTVEVANGAFDIRKHESRTEAVEHRKADKGIKSHRDYFILDVEAFEDYLDSNVDKVSYGRTPSGLSSGKKLGSKYYTPEYIASLSPEEAAKLALEMAKERASRPKRTVTESQIERMQAARYGKGSKKKK